jgi:lipoprotein-anchoring transpeptidase ErfK/SrfK
VAIALLVRQELVWLVFAAANLVAMALWPTWETIPFHFIWVIGIHGTDQPQLIPGRPSHGCIRVPNWAIERLVRLMPLGTPVLIR